MNEPILRMREIDKTFAGVKALKRVEFEIHQGEVVGLVGENGAGKSTLMRILSGIIVPDSGTGEITIDGTSVQFDRGPRSAQQHGIGMIPQELMLIDQLSVEENIFLGREPVSPVGRIKVKERREKTKEILRSIGCDHIAPDQPVKKLSKANQQLVAISRRLIQGGRVFIMDEPTAALTQQEAERLFSIIRNELCPRGYSVVFISHRLEEVLSLSDRVIVLRDGERVATINDVHQGQRATLVRHMIGRTVEEEYPKVSSEIGDAILTIQSIRYQTNQGSPVQNLSLSVRRGEVVGVTGLAGVGKTELGQVLMGLRDYSDGSIYLNGVKANLDSPSHAVRAGIGYVSEDRRSEGLVLNISSLQNMSLSQPFRYRRMGGLLDHKKEVTTVSAIAERMRMKPRYISMDAGALSGGNQQKAVIIRQLLREVSLIIFDEPTKGIDVGAKSEIARIIGELSQAGKGILLLTSEPREVLGLSDTIYVLNRHALAGPFERDSIDYARLMQIELGEHNSEVTADVT